MSFPGFAAFVTRSGSRRERKASEKEYLGRGSRSVGQSKKGEGEKEEKSGANKEDNKIPLMVAMSIKREAKSGGPARAM